MNLQEVSLAPFLVDTKKPWIPCEGESAAIRLVLEHFQHFIRESKNTTIHHTDSQPCVLEWKKGQRGAFSSSSRVSSFLVGLSALPLEIRYKPGNLMHTSDYASRHPSPCQTRRCQICSFVGDWESIGDNAATIRSISIEDVKSGKTIMPLIQRKTWLNIRCIQMVKICGVFSFDTQPSLQVS